LCEGEGGDWEESGRFSDSGIEERELSGDSKDISKLKGEVLSSERDFELPRRRRRDDFTVGRSVEAACERREPKIGAHQESIESFSVTFSRFVFSNKCPNTKEGEHFFVAKVKPGEVGVLGEENSEHVEAGEAQRESAMQRRGEIEIGLDILKFLNKKNQIERHGIKRESVKEMD